MRLSYLIAAVVAVGVAAWVLTGESGRAILAPIAAGNANPMVPSPPEVMSDLGVLWR